MIDDCGLREELLRDRHRLDHRLDLPLQIVTLVDHVGDVGAAPRLMLEQPNLVENAEHLVRIDRTQRQVVVGIAPVVEMESAEHLFGEQPRHDLLDVLRQVMMAGVDEHAGVGPGGAGEQQRHAPVADVGVVERGLERLVLHEQSLTWRERAMARLQRFDEPLAPLADVRAPRIVRSVREPQ